MMFRFRAESLEPLVSIPTIINRNNIIYSLESMQKKHACKEIKLEASQRNRFILPTLQSNFNYAINEVLKRMNTVGIAETWRAIETLFTILPPKIYEVVETDYNDIVKKVNTVTNGSTVDFLAMVESNNECCIVLEELAFPFFRKCYELLYKGGYLEKQSSRLSAKHFNELESEET